MPRRVARPSRSLVHTAVLPVLVCAACSAPPPLPADAHEALLADAAPGAAPAGPVALEIDADGVTAVEVPVAAGRVPARARRALEGMCGGEVRFARRLLRDGALWIGERGAPALRFEVDDEGAVQCRAHLVERAAAPAPVRARAGAADRIWVLQAGATETFRVESEHAWLLCDADGRVRARGTRRAAALRVTR